MANAPENEQYTGIYLDRLTPGAQRLVVNGAGSSSPGVNDWTAALLGRYAAMAEAMVPGFDAAAVRRGTQRELREGRQGDPLSKEIVIERAISRCDAAGKLRASETDLAAVILDAAGFGLVDKTGA